MKIVSIFISMLYMMYIFITFNEDVLRFNWRYMNKFMYTSDDVNADWKSWIK